MSQEPELKEDFEDALDDVTGDYIRCALFNYICHLEQTRNEARKEAMTAQREADALAVRLYEAEAEIRRLQRPVFEVIEGGRCEPRSAVGPVGGPAAALSGDASSIEP